MNADWIKMENNNHSKKSLAITVNGVDKVASPVNVALFGLSLDSWSTSAQFMAVSSGVMTCYLIYGYIQVSRHFIAFI